MNHRFTRRDILRAAAAGAAASTLPLRMPNPPGRPSR